MKHAFTKLLIQALVPSIALYGVVLPARAGAKEVTCESSSMRRTYCGVGTHGDIRLISRQGRWPCRQNETWGIENEGIWVDQNCRGRFAVDDAPSSGNSNASAIAAVIGIAAIAAIAASKNRRDDDRPPDYGGPDYGHPNWLVGRFSGYSHRDRQYLRLDIGPSGRVISRGERETYYGRMLGNDQMGFDNGARYFVQPFAGGIRLLKADNRREYIDLQRER